MKRVINASLAAFCLAFSSCTQSGDPGGITITVPVHCTIARHGCSSDAGLCDCHLGLASVQELGGNSRLRNMTVEVAGGYMYARIPDTLPTGAKTFEFDAPTQMADSIAFGLGFKEVTVQPGGYTPVKDKDGLRTVVKMIVKTK